MRIAICTGAWKRHHLLDFVCQYYADMKTSVGTADLDIELIVACSQDEAMETCQRHGHTCFMVDNTPLYAKFNAAVQKAEEWDADIVINIGSDDIMTPDLIRYYVQTFVDEQVDFIATLDWYFFDTKTKQGMYWKGYDQPHNMGKTCGAGRAMNRRLLDMLNWQPWLPGYDRVLDTGMQVLLDRLKYKSHIFRMREHRLFGLDIKTDQNMTPFDRWNNTTIFKNGAEMLDTYVSKYTKRIMSL